MLTCCASLVSRPGKHPSTCKTVWFFGVQNSRYKMVASTYPCAGQVALEKLSKNISIALPHH